MNRLLTLVVALFLAALPSGAQDMKARAKLYLKTDGPEVRAALEVRIESGWHLYHEDKGNPEGVGEVTTVTPGGEGIEWSPVRFPEPYRLEQPGIGPGGSDVWIWSHEGRIVMYALGRTTDGSDVDRSSIEFAIKGLTCEDEGSCIPYKEKVGDAGEGTDRAWRDWPDDLEIGAAPAQEEVVHDDFGPTTEGTEVNEKTTAELFVRKVAGGLRAVLLVDVEEPYHLYHTDLGDGNGVGQATEVEMGGAGLLWSEARMPEPERLEQPNMGPGGSDAWIWGHGGRIPILFEASGDVAPEVVRAHFKGLTCEEGGSCILIDAVLASAGPGPDALFERWPDDLAPEGRGGLEGGVSTRSTGASAGAGVTDDFDWAGVTYPDYEPRGGELERSLLMWLVFAFIAGMILNVMPCVLPVVSIKVLSFVQQAGESKRRVFTLGLAFSAGIIIVFLGLAAFTTLAGAGWGDQFQSEPFKIVMVAIVFGFSLSLFDVFELGVPSAVGNVASMKREGHGDAFFKGMMATILATPCSGPFLGSTMAWAIPQPPLIAFSVFLVAGLGMAFPYAILTSNPALLKYVPKPGAWMETFKHLMGFLLLGTVVFLLVSVRQDLLIYTVSLMIFVAMGCWWWGKKATFDKSTAQKLIIFATSVAIIALGAWFSFGPLQNTLDPKSRPSSGEHLAWVDFDPVKLEQYHAEGRPVMLDFTADWCLTCKMNEKFVYESEAVIELLRQKGAVAMKADMTGDSPKTDAIERLRDQLGAASIPFMAIFPGDTWEAPYTFKDLVTIDEVSEALRELRDSELGSR